MFEKQHFPHGFEMSGKEYISYERNLDMAAGACTAMVFDKVLF